MWEVLRFFHIYYVCICVFYFIASILIDFSFSISAVPSLGLVLPAHDIQKHLWICGHLRPTTWWWAVTALIIPSVMRAVVILLMEVRHSIMGINQTQWVLRSLSSGILDERACWRIPIGHWVVEHRPLVVSCCHMHNEQSCLLERTICLILTYLEVERLLLRVRI